ncbi:hypothetical protein P152DRAFT_475906 [Eremomyces bilateralis CBS 781.70]|uniref:Uncharacterized protein n=1 Tax=Eremomyces bilateralis CBS 781.70 TaxID=1392243 RepID=A0A6G1FWH7_9PEZI|nr:uncharacterized protein P152DRAFT_475906 [Eremomyces bilateralis CBS 781.70]KAF1810052.1 hypothetical protein P152DRAFT_475906 [Eremomyces bilateralis CBS 781.70]
MRKSKIGDTASVEHHIVDSLEAVQGLRFTMVERWPYDLEVYLNATIDEELESKGKVISMLNLLLCTRGKPSQYTYMINIDALKEVTFNTAFNGRLDTARGTSGPISLRTDLEGTLFAKVIFNCKTISHLLFERFHICMQSVREVQFSKCATLHKPNKQ